MEITTVMTISPIVVFPEPVLGVVLEVGETLMSQRDSSDSIIGARGAGFDARENSFMVISLMNPSKPD